MSDSVLSIQAQPSSWRDAENVETFLEQDAAFQRAMQAAVAASKLQIERWPLGEEKRYEPFPEELRRAVIESACAYSQAVTDCRQIAPGSTVDAFAACERRITEARTAMRYRTCQALMHLGLWNFYDREGFDTVWGWKPGDYATDKAVTS